MFNTYELVATNATSDISNAQCPITRNAEIFLRLNIQHKHTVWANSSNFLPEVNSDLVLYGVFGLIGIQYQFLRSFLFIAISNLLYSFIRVTARRRMHIYMCVCVCVMWVHPKFATFTRTFVHLEFLCMSHISLESHHL